MEETNYAFTKVVELNYEETIAKVIDELHKEGFGILTEIDVKTTLKKKIDVDLKPYIILGACNPPVAFKALQAEEQIGLMLPCNVIVYVNEDEKTVVAAIDPVASMMSVNNPGLSDLSEKIRSKIRLVIEKV